MTEELQHIVSLEEYEKVIKENKFVIVDFFSKWCDPCREISPIFVEQSKIFTEAKFIKVDIDEANEISEKEKIKCVPTFLFYKDGKKSKKLKEQEIAY